MKQPSNYELKKWLCENAIVGIIIHYPIYDCEDEVHTEVTLVSTMGIKKRTRAEAVWSFIDIKPNRAYLAHTKPEVRKEIEAWERFAADEAFDLKEFARLKEKFGG